MAFLDGTWASTTVSEFAALAVGAYSVAMAAESERTLRLPSRTVLAVGQARRSSKDTETNVA